MSKIKNIMSWNVNGIRSIEKKSFVKWLKQTAPDVLCFQEIKATEEQIPKSINDSKDYFSFWNSSVKKGYAGVGILSQVEPLSVQTGIKHKRFDLEGRVLTCEFVNYYVISVYFPNAQEELKRLKYKLEFNESFTKFVSALRSKKDVVICGDYNVAHNEIDLERPKANENNAGFSWPERQWMTSFLKKGFLDTFRLFNDHPRQYTWWSYRAQARRNNIGWRIDYVCVNHEAKKRVKKAYIMKDVLGSDHCPVGIEFLS